jgi:hypothetical protein
MRERRPVAPTDLRQVPRPTQRERERSAVDGSDFPRGVAIEVMAAMLQSKYFG